MVNLIGTYECRADAKGRVMFSSAFKKQLSSVLQEGFVSLLCYKRVVMVMVMSSGQTVSHGESGNEWQWVVGSPVVSLESNGSSFFV